MPELSTRGRKHMKGGRVCNFSCYKGQLLVSADTFISVNDWLVKSVPLMG